MRDTAVVLRKKHAVVRDAAVVLRRKHAVVRHKMYKYVVVHTSKRDKPFNAQANAKHQSSNNMAKGLVSRIAVVPVKARIGAAQRIPGICGEQRNALNGSAPVFSSLRNGMADTMRSTKNRGLSCQQRSAQHHSINTA